MVKKTQRERAQEDRSVLDIHDTIQQHMFALTMLVGTLKLLLKQDPDAALNTVHEIEHLVQLVRADLQVMRLELSQPGD